MLKEAPGQLNFTHFLTLFGEKMHGKTASAPAPSPRGRWRHNATRNPVTSYRGRVSYPGVKPASASGSWFFLPAVDFVDSLWSACAAVTLATCETQFSDLVYTFFSGQDFRFQQIYQIITSHLFLDPFSSQTFWTEATPYCLLLRNCVFSVSMVTLACLYSNPLSCTVLQAGKPTLAWSRRCWRNPQASSISHIFSHYLVKKCMVRPLNFSSSFLLTIYHTHSFMNSPSLSLLSLSLILLSAILSISEAIIFRRSRTHRALYYITTLAWQHVI